MNSKSLTVNGRTYTVHITDADPLLQSNPDVFGFTDHKNLCIVVRKSVAPRILQETLLHEMLHAVLDSSGATAAIERVDRADVHEVLISALVPTLLEWMNIENFV